MPHHKAEYEGYYIHYQQILCYYWNTTHNNFLFKIYFGGKITKNIREISQK